MALQMLQLTNMPANATRDMMLDADQGATELRKIVRPSKIVMAIVATVATIELEVKAGLRSVVPRSQLETGGTASVFPNLDQKAFTVFAGSFEDIQVLVRDIGGAGTGEIMLTIDVTPIA
jgi:hypothetical protein